MRAPVKAGMYFTAAALIFGSVVAGRAMFSTPTLDDAQCATDKRRAPSRHVVVLVDPSDPLSPEQWAVVDGVTQLARSSLARGQRLSLFVLGDRPGAPPARQLFSRCHPGDRADANAMVENPRKLQKRYDEQFAAVLDRAIAELKASPPAEWSPVVEAVHRIATLETLGPTVPDRTLIIVSDLLEHSSLASAYRGELSVARLDRSVYLDQIKGRLAGVSVTVHQIKTRRRAELQGPALEAFWRELFTRSVASRVSMQWM